MKTVRFLLFASCLTLAVSSCSVFKPKYGCPATGKNMGAESLLDESKARKTKKFKA